jgi:hypothetical protein
MGVPDCAGVRMGSSLVYVPSKLLVSAGVPIVGINGAGTSLLKMESKFIGRKYGCSITSKASRSSDPSRRPGSLTSN